MSIIVTVDSVMACRPCHRYTREGVEAIIRGSARPLTDMLWDKHIPVEDRVWLGIALISVEYARMFACDCAGRALWRIKNPAVELLRCVETAWRYATIRGGDAPGWSDVLSAMNDARNTPWCQARYAVVNCCVKDARRGAYLAAKWSADYGLADRERAIQLERLEEYASGDIPESIYPTE